MNFFKKHRRFTNILCSALVVSMLLPGVVSSAAKMESLHQPKKMTLGEKIEQTSFLNEKSKKIELDFSGDDYTLLTFWASWCPDCREEFEHIPYLAEVLEEYDNVRWYLVDLVDHEWETVKSGKAYVDKMGIDVPVLYDDKRALTNELKVAEIPTMVVLDPDGKPIVSAPGVIKTKSKLRAFIDYAVEGGDQAVLGYLQEEVMKEEKISSQERAMLADYASQRGHMDILREQAQWLRDHKMTTGHLGGDLAMYSALSPHKGFEVETMELGKGILNRYFEGDKLTGKLSVGEIDLSVIKNVGGDKKYQKALSVVENAYISDKFPLYYTTYSNGKYSKSRIDTAESLMAVYHLAEQGKVSKKTLNWLDKAVSGNGLAPAYDKDGKAINTKKGSQPALYALSAMIGLESGDMDLFTHSMYMLEDLRTFGGSSDGKFKCSSDKVFHHVMPLMLYAEMEVKGL